MTDTAESRPETARLTTNLRKITDVLGGDYKRELDLLIQFYEAQEDALPFQVGDRVALTDAVSGIDYVRSYGWSSNEPILQPGNTGTVTAHSWYAGRWSYSFRFDAEWSLSVWGSGLRIYGQPSDRRHTFMMPERFLREVGVDDRPRLPFEDAESYNLGGSKDMTRAELCAALTDQTAVSA